MLLARVVGTNGTSNAVACRWSRQGLGRIQMPIGTRSNPFGSRRQRMAVHMNRFGGLYMTRSGGANHYVSRDLAAQAM